MLLITCLGGLIFWLKPPSFNHNQAWLDAQVVRITSGELVPKQGVVTLDGKAPRGAWGDAYVSGSATQGWMIFFPYWRGKGTNVEGFLYRSTPSTAKYVSLPVYWGPPAPPGSTPSPQPPTFDLEVETPLNANWSIAAWRLD